MKVKVRLGGIMSSQCGWREQEFNLAPDSTIAELKRAIEQNVTGFEFESFCASAAINQTVGHDQSPLHDGDEVVFLPPLAGG